MFAVNLAIFSAFYFYGYPIKNDLPVAAMQGLGLVSTIAASIYVAMMALYYAKSRRHRPSSKARCASTWRPLRSYAWPPRKPSGQARPRPNSSPR